MRIRKNVWGWFYLNIDSISDINSEAGVIASVIINPKLTFFSEQLEPNYFTDATNAYVYWAVRELARRGVEKIDAYAIDNMLKSKTATRDKTQDITIRSLNELFDTSRYIARNGAEDYMILVEKVVDCAYRRDTVKKLEECERYCFDSRVADVEQKIYSTLDDVMMKFSTKSEVPPYRDVVDGLWSEIVARQGNECAGIPFKFPSLNHYASIEPGELFIFAAEAKQGKSMMLLNCAVDLLKRDQAVLYLDSELNSRMFTSRLISHLTGIEYKRLKTGDYSAEEAKRIEASLRWIKSRNFTHIYIPMFDEQTIYSAVKKVKHTQGLDVLIVDYFKGNSNSNEAFATYAELGRLVDTVKNRILGDMGICGLGAAQATSTGKLADSAKIARNASTIAFIQDKTPEEIDADGPECGNKKLVVAYNRNGEQMRSGEYIDLFFNGNLISYKEAQQHIPVAPF